MKRQRWFYVLPCLLAACAAGGIKPSATDGAEAAAQAAAAAADAASDPANDLPAAAAVASESGSEPRNEPAAADRCPVLPADAGFAWTYRQGPDFGLCYASATGSSKTAFGLYLGNYPSFDPGLATAIGKGRVAGREVTWYAPDDGNAQGRQTLIVLDKEWGYVAHLWVTPGSQQELQARLSALERMTFK
jgi:hypothetical protein